MYVYKCVYMYVCMCVHTYKYVSNIYVCVCVCVCCVNQTRSKEHNSKTYVTKQEVKKTTTKHM